MRHLIRSPPPSPRAAAAGAPLLTALAAPRSDTESLPTFYVVALDSIVCPSGLGIPWTSLESSGRGR